MFHPFTYLNLSSINVYPLKDVIIAYLESCKRKPASASDDEDDLDEDDHQTNEEFEAFKKWLDESTPSSTPAAPAPAASTALTPPLLVRKHARSVV